MFELLKELTINGTPEKVLITEEAKFTVMKNVNSISLTKRKEEGSNKMEITPDNTEKPTKTQIEILVKEAEIKNEAKNGAKNKSVKPPENEKAVKAPSSQPFAYYPKHNINEKLINGLVDNNRFNNSLSGTRGSDVNVMPCFTYTKLTDERPVETDIRLSLASHSYIYPLGIGEDVLVEVAEHIYPVDFVIMDIKENEKRPFILGIPFLTTTKAVIKFDMGTITLRSGKNFIKKRRWSLTNGEARTLKTNTLLLLKLKKNWKKNEKSHKDVIFDEKKLGHSEEFSWMTLGGQFNQLSHVSSPLERKPGEY
nr:hypothetical protein [Tanacetum cinerariifolium]